MKIKVDVERKQVREMFDLYNYYPTAEEVDRIVGEMKDEGWDMELLEQKIENYLYPEED